MFGFDELIQVIRAVTGWDYSLHELMLLGERKLNMLKVFNVREGFTAEDDMLPDRMFTLPLEDEGPSSGRTVSKEDFLQVRKQYYGVCGWNPESGVPTKEKLVELGLDWTVKMLDAEPVPV